MKITSNETITLSKYCRLAKIERNYAEKVLAEFLSMGCIHIDLESTPVQYSLNSYFDLKKLT